jgi:hypothetical protein
MRTLLALILIVLVPSAARANDKADSPAALLQEVQGEWVRSVRTPNGLVTMHKVHDGHRSVVTATDAGGNVLYAHESEFQVRQDGPIRIFTFYNRKVTAGPSKGKIEKEPHSFLYRVEQNRFIEAYGLLDGDKEPPSMTVWERPGG